MTGKMMKTVGYQRAGDPTVLGWFERPHPEPGAHDLIVRVKAVSVNPADVMIRASATPADGTARVLGFDAAGIVERVGSAVTRFGPGDEVFYAGVIDRPGSDAEQQAVDERNVGHKPKSLSWTQAAAAAAAAALPLTTLTAWELLFDRMRVPFGAKTVGDTLLVMNGAGGVGSILTQLARRLTGLTVIATASRPKTIEWCTRLGAHHVVDHHKPLDEELARIGIPQAEYVAGLTDSDRHLPAIAKLIAPQGVLALFDDPETLDIVPFKTKAATIAWEFMFARPKFESPDMTRQGFILDETATLVDAGLIETTLTRTFGALAPDTLAEAHAFVENAKGFGKVVSPGIEEENA